MLKEQLIAQTTPVADKNNMVYWMDYRVTVLTDRLFRVEKSPEGNLRGVVCIIIRSRNRKQPFCNFLPQPA